MLCLRHLFPCLLLCYSLFSQACYSFSDIYKNATSTTSKHSCLIDESSALLHFKSSFKIDTFRWVYPKTRSWRNDTDCCSQWDGVTCNPVTGHVIGLDLSYSKLYGTIGSNSSMFLLGHLESLNLADNEFSGEVPVELSHLRSLTSLDLSYNDELAIPSFKTMIGNLTQLRQLDLSTTSIDSFIPESLTNLSSLESLQLYSCGLRGKLPPSMLSLSHLRVLDLYGNDKLYTGSIADELFNWSSPLELLDLSGTNFSQRQLPHSISPAAMSKSLRGLHLSNCSFYGPIPSWVWNVTQDIDLSDNDFIGELPLPSNLTRLSTLYSLILSNNSLNGTVPSWLFHLPSITELRLDLNQYGGNLIDIFAGNASNSLVESNDLSYNKIYGSIPESLFNHSNLKHLDLSSNNLTGTIELHMFSNFKNLEHLGLSNNYLSVLTSEFNSPLSLPNLSTLLLSSCNMNKFPFFGESTLQALQALDLSKNKIQGEIPKWSHDTVLLSFLNLSYNSLTGGLENLPSMASIIDVSHNALRGPLPLQVFPPYLGALMASNNRISGSIHSSICNHDSLHVLDLSNNILDGPIPDCLGSSSSYLGVLNLGSNNLSGRIPPNFSNCDGLGYIDLSNNRLEGVVPPSLAHCSSLEVVNLGNNMLNDTFPHLLATLSDLKVLNLRSNYFHGPLITGTRSHSKQLFSKLRVLDLSRNHFKGTLPSKFIANMRAMKYLGEDEVKVRQYLQSAGEYFSVTITIKGSDLNVQRILSTLTTIDVSSNMFEGNIPTSIGDLGALHLLNFSHNSFANKIPSSIGNLKDLESLDLSCNNLSGEIPKEVGRLGFLEVFNVSYNQLVGPIPQGPQLNTFPNESYLGNPGLCGPPLSKRCTIEDPPVISNPPTDEEQDEREWWEDIHLWQVILTGYGLGLVIGLVSGYFMLSARNPLWLSRLVYNFEYRVSQWLKMRGRGQRTRAQRN